MTMTPAQAVPAAEPAAFPVRTPEPARNWLGWSLAAMGFAALALSLAVSLGQAEAASVATEPAVELTGL